MSTLASFPEELLDRVLALSLASSDSSRPDWHKSSHRIAPLLVSKSWLRISTPLFYHSITLRTPQQAQSLTQTFRDVPELARSLRNLLVPACWPCLPDLFALCPALESLDFTLDAGVIPAATPNSLQNAPSPPPVEAVDPDAQAFSDALDLTNLKHITVRKPPSVYLTHSKPRYILSRLSTAIQKWSHLETAHLAFRLTDDASGLATALAHAPRLHTLSAQLPTVWNPSLLTASTNPTLERIQLCTANPGEVIVGTGMFFMEARNHKHLSDLIRAGTPIIRTRAHTMGTLSPSRTLACTPKPISLGKSKEIAAALKRPSSPIRVHTRAL